MRIKIDASDLLAEATERHNIHLSLLVADTGLWVNPAFHYRLIRNTGSAAMFPTVRRARIGQGEQRGQIDDAGVRFDDNSYANRAIKHATGLGKLAVGFETCHIWPLTCYDERYHTAVANLVLLPRALASLSDHVIEIQAALQYRAFELYEWFPEEMPQPTKPDFYPSTWRKPQSDPVKTRTRHMPSASSVSLSGTSEYQGKASTILHHEHYLDFIKGKGVGKNGRAASLESYLSSLKSVARLLNCDITPDLLRFDSDVVAVAQRLEGRKNPSTIKNYKSAMRQYVAMVQEFGL